MPRATCQSCDLQIYDNSQASKACTQCREWTHEKCIDSQVNYGENGDFYCKKCTQDESEVNYNEEFEGKYLSLIDKVKDGTIKTLFQYLLEDRQILLSKIEELDNKIKELEDTMVHEEQNTTQDTTETILDNSTKKQEEIPQKNPKEVKNAVKTDFSRNVITMATGNLLTALEEEEVSAIAHCISADMHMGAGIAKKIKEKYRTDTSNTNEAKIGDVITQVVEDKLILHVVTKSKYYEPFPTWNNYKLGIKNLLKICEEKSIDKLHIPKLGCGLDALNWEKCFLLLKQLFTNSKTKVTVLVQDPSAETDYRRISETKKTKMPTNKTIHVDMLGDSHTLDMGVLMNIDDNGDHKYYASAHAGADTAKVTQDLNIKTAHLQPKDFLIIMAGANDISNNKTVEECLPKEAWKNIASQCLHTSVIICTVPQRLDNEELNEKVKAFNSSMIDFYRSEASALGHPDRIKFIEINNIINESDYNNSKFHLLRSGKEQIVKAIKMATSRLPTNFLL